jgi:hypothetical protein
MKQLLSTLFIITAAANMALAGDKPNFSGTWKLDMDKSSFGPIPPPESMTRRVDHKDPDISVEMSITGPDLSMSFRYSTDGKETANSFMGADFKSKAVWEGKALVIHNIVDAANKSTNKWSLSDDGKTLTDVWTVSSPNGDFEVTYVLAKQ